MDCADWRCNKESCRLIKGLKNTLEYNLCKSCETGRSKETCKTCSLGVRLQGSKMYLCRIDNTIGVYTD